MTAPQVVGLDLSITATGVASGDRTYTIKYPNGCAGDRRLQWLRQAIAVELGSTGTDLVVIEDLPTHAHGAGITGMVHGAVRALLLEREVPYVLVPPATLKKFATGNGGANKTAMALAAYKRAGVEFADDNCCDSWWLQAMGLDALGHPAFPLPESQRAALTKCAWPALEVVA